MPNSPIRLLVVDDHTLFRQGLIRILGDYAQLQIVGQAANGQDALALVGQLQPDVVMLPGETIAPPRSRAVLSPSPRPSAREIST